MKQTGQRQDVAFLALAVAVLAIAVALFVGVRALSTRRASKPADQPSAPKAMEKAASTQPPGSRSHDPFKGKVSPAQSSTALDKPMPAEQLRLVGIVQGRGRELLAAIRRGNDRYYVKQGGSVGEYTVVEITSGRVVLTKGDEKLTLLLHGGRRQPSSDSRAPSAPG